MSGTDVAAVLAKTQVLIDLRRFTDAAASARLALATDGSCARAACLLAQAELLAGNDVPAFDAAALGIKLAPDLSWAQRLMAIAYSRFGINEHEIRHAREAVRLEPDLSPGYGCLARALARERTELQQAWEVANLGVRLAPHSVDAHMAVAFVAERSGDRDAAKDALLRALALDPQNPVAHNDLARLRHSVSRFGLSPDALADAADGLARAVRADPGRQISRLNLDLVIRTFFAWTAYLIFCDALLCGFGQANSATLRASILPVALLALPIGYALRFLYRVDPSMRLHIANELRSDRAVSIAAALTALATLLIVVSAALAPFPRSLLDGLAAVAALTGRLVLHEQLRAISARARREALAPAISTPTLWMIAALIAVMTGFLALAYTRAGGGPGELIAAVIGAAMAMAIAEHARRRGQ